jgi:two-component system OmpR family response regulator
VSDPTDTAGLPVRILAIEDQQRLARAIKIGLEDQGFSVDLAGDGAEGLFLARQGAYDAIVLDILLPKLNGYQVCAKLRGDGDWTPILMLSAKSGEWDHAEALDTGADDFLAKPFSFVVLVAHLRALLRRGRRERAEPLVAGDLVLDPTAHRCRRGDTDIALTPREFALLEYLMRQADQVCDKTEIIDNVWEFDFQGDDNIVEVYIRYLRRKIDLPFDRHAIQTIRHLGYRLSSDGG